MADVNIIASIRELNRAVESTQTRVSRKCSSMHGWCMTRHHMILSYGLL